MENNCTGNPLSGQSDNDHHVLVTCEVFPRPACQPVTFLFNSCMKLRHLGASLGGESYLIR